MWLDVRGYRKCLFDLIDEVAGHDLYKFSSTKTPKLELKNAKSQAGDELRASEQAGARPVLEILLVVPNDDSTAKLMVERSKMRL